MAGQGLFQIVAWPTHVGALNISGDEPWHYSDYKRSQICWELKEGRMTGSTASEIFVPAGVFTHLVFAHHPTLPLVLATETLDYPFDFKVPGVITLKGIVQEDFTTKAEKPFDTMLRIIKGANGKLSATGGDRTRIEL